MATVHKGAVGIGSTLQRQQMVLTKVKYLVPGHPFPKYRAEFESET